MKSSHEGDRAVHEAPNANPTEIQSTSFVAAVISDIADMDNAAFRQILAKATDGANGGQQPTSTQGRQRARDEAAAVGAEEGSEVDEDPPFSPQPSTV